MVHKSETVGLSRRQVLTGAAAVGVATLLPKLALARTPQRASADVAALVATQVPRTSHRVVSMQNGYHLLIGGYLGGVPTSSVLAIDASTGDAYSVAPMATRRVRHAAALLPDGRVVVLGGQDRNLLMTVECYDPNTGVWSALPALPSPRADFDAVPVPGGLVLYGGTAMSGTVGNAFYPIADQGVRP